MTDADSPQNLAGDSAAPPSPTWRFEPTRLPDVIRIDPVVHRDPRGFFLETYNEQTYASGGVHARFVQDNHSRSARGVLRGLHAQLNRPQGKLVRVVEGEIWDVAVDIRRGSATFGQWVGTALSAESFRQLWIPPDFAHGFCVLSESAQVEYKVTDFWDPDDEITIAWNDPGLAIEWPIESPLLSQPDRDGRPLAELHDLLPGVDDPGRGDGSGTVKS